MRLAQGYNAVMQVMLEPAAPRFWVKHCTTEPLRSPHLFMNMKVELYISKSFPFNHNLIRWMSAITSERYNHFGKTLFII